MTVARSGNNNNGSNDSRQIPDLANNNNGSNDSRQIR